MPVAPGTIDLRAHHAIAAIASLGNVALGYGLKETRPTGTRMKLGIGREQREATPGAGVNAGGLIIQQRTTKGSFRAAGTQHVKLLRGKPLPPLVLAELELLGLDRTD